MLHWENVNKRLWIKKGAKISQDKQNVFFTWKSMQSNGSQTTKIRGHASVSKFRPQTPLEKSYICVIAVHFKWKKKDFFKKENVGKL